MVHKMEARLENEKFIAKVRWLTVFGTPVIFWFSRGSVTMGLLLITVVFCIYNLSLHLYVLNKINLERYQALLSVIDVTYLTSVYILALLGHDSIPQLYYFLILVMGIRHGLTNYPWIVLINGVVYASSTILATRYLGYDINTPVLLNQSLFFIAFGVMSSYIFKKEFQQQMEKEDLISELQAAYQQLCLYNAQVEELANTDPLTGLFNYRYFTDRLDKELDMAKQFNGFLSLIIIDIDHFKDFNDTYGHPVGDLALKEAARIFHQNIRDKDILCRYGGEEFLILLPGTGIDEAFKCAERIRRAVQHHTIKIDENQSVRITISGGVACFPLDASNGEQLLRIADEVLYSAKHRGRNKIHRRL